jgi:hypothetical protein
MFIPLLISISGIAKDVMGVWQNPGMWLKECHFYHP